jgi:hypothetical protein
MLATLADHTTFACAAKASELRPKFICSPKPRENMNDLQRFLITAIQL